MIKLSNASQEKELHGYICTHINSIPPVSGVGITEKEAWKDMITKSCESMISEYERYRGPVEPGGAVFNAITDICVNRKCTTMEKF